MKSTIAVVALLFLPSPTWAQGAAPPPQHHSQPSSQPAASAPDKASAEASPDKMGMAEHCKMMQQSRDSKALNEDTHKSMDCPAMHHKMHSSDGTPPRH